MTPRARNIGLALAFAGLLVVIDTVVTIVALPAIITDLETPLARGAWTTTGYILGLIGILPLAGWLAGRFGDRRVYMIGLSTFIVASIAAGFAPNVEILISFRVIQGMGGGVLNPLATAIALRAAPRDARGRMMSLVGLPVLIGPVVGAPLTALLVGATTWRWAFWINLPLGTIALALCSRYLPRSQSADDSGSADWLGALMVVGGSVGLVLACTMIGETGTVGAATGIAAVAGATLLGGFMWRSFRSVHPLIQIRLLARREVAAGAVILLCFSGGYFGALAIIPTFVQGVRGDAVSLAGVLSIPVGLAVGITLQLATRLVDRIAPRQIIVAGTGIALIGALCVGAALAFNASYLVIGVLSVLIGVGSGATLMPTMVAATRNLGGPSLPQASTLLALSGQLGSALGTALVASTITVLVGTRVGGLRDSGEGVLAAMVGLEPAERAPLIGELATAVGLSYLTPGVFLLAAFGVAVLGLRSTRTVSPPAARKHSVASSAPDGQY